MSEAFIRRHRADWERFSAILTKLESIGNELLPEEDVRIFGPLYRKISSDLAYVKAQQLDPELLEYLNDLAGRGYNQLYTATTRSTSLKHFFVHQLPTALRRQQRYFWAALVLVILGTYAGYMLTRHLPYIAEGLFPKVIGENLLNRFKNDQWFNNPLEQRPLVASLILTNNVRVALLAFGTGIAAGLLTFSILLFNCMLLGHLAAYFTRHGHAYPFWAAILPHGIIELTALALAAAGGWILGMTLLFPNEYRRSDALRIKAPDAACLFLSSVFLLGIAGLIEGLFSTIPTQSIPNEIRLGVAALTLIFLVVMVRILHLDPRTLIFPSKQNAKHDTNSKNTPVKLSHF